MMEIKAGQIKGEQYLESKDAYDKFIKDPTPIYCPLINRRCVDMCYNFYKGRVQVLKKGSSSYMTRWSDSPEDLEAIVADSEMTVWGPGCSFWDYFRKD
jgi:hypothetical protein